MGLGVCAHTPGVDLLLVEGAKRHVTVKAILDRIAASLTLKEALAWALALAILYVCCTKSD